MPPRYVGTPNRLRSGTDIAPAPFKWWRNMKPSIRRGGWRSPQKPGRVWMPPVWQEEFSDDCQRMRNSIGRVSGLIMWPEVATGRDAVRRTESTSVQRAWLARAPGLPYPIPSIEVLSASFRQSIFSPGLITPGPFRIAAQGRQRITPSCNSAPLSSSPI